MKKILSVLTALVLLVSAMTITAVANDQNVVYVSTVEELESSLASNTKIVLSPGRYVFRAEKMMEYFDDGTAWEYELPKCLNINGLSNVTVEGNNQAEIVLDVGFEAVVRIANSENIVISGLILGHDVPAFGCEGEGYVIDVSHSKNTLIQNCDLYGCGVTGINAWSGGDITVNNTIIRECMVNGASFYSMNGDITFNDCTFTANAYDEYYAQTIPFFEFRQSEEISYVSQVSINRCTFTGNKNVMFTDITGDKSWLSVNDCTFSDNAWETAVNVKIYDYGYWSNHFFEDQRPVIVDGRTLVPLRGILESLGYEIVWNDATRSATITKYDVPYAVEVAIDSNKILKGSETVEIDVPATIINNRTMVPIRAISEAFDMKVDWDNDSRSVLIYADEN